MTDPRHETRKTKLNGWHYCLLGCFGFILIAWLAIIAWLGYIIIPVLIRFYG